MQLTEPSWYRLVYYSSRKLSDAEPNYLMTEREALGMIDNVNKFRNYLLRWKQSLTGKLYLVAKSH